MIQKPTKRDFEEKIRKLETKLRFYEDRENLRGESHALETTISEQRFRNLIEGSIQGVLIHRDHKPLFVNNQWASIHGYSTEEILNMQSIIPLISPKDQARMIDYKDARLKGKSAPINYEYEGVRKDGSFIWLENRVMIVQWEGQPAIQTTIFDITDRKKANEALRESEELHRIILSNISDAVFITDDKGDFTYICPNVRVIFGCSYEEIDALNNINNLLDMHGLNRSELIASGEIKNFERAIQDKNGATHIILVNVKLVSIKGGTMLFTCHDITERKRAHVKLQESEERYRQLFDNASDAVMIFDAQSTNFEDANSAAADLFGYTKDEFTELRVEDISVENDNARHTAGKAGINISGDKYEHLHYFRKKNGAVFPGEIYAGNFISNFRKKIIGAVRDVTNRIKAEETIRALSFSLLTAQEMERKRIASELHDDIGQTLAYLKIRIQNLQKILPPNQDNLHEECINTIEHTNQLIEKVRIISHGLTPIFLDDLGLTASLHSLVDEFSGYSSIKIEKHFANVDRLFSLGVEITIYRILQEIFNNIWKHAESNFVKIEIDKMADNVSFEIEDSGRGFDLGNIRLFSADQKGLGLASVKERVRMLGGRFEIQSRLNKGTNVSFEIPFESASR